MMRTSAGAALVALLFVSLPAGASAPVHLRPCVAGGTNALCGTFRVPENRAAPAGKWIDLKVVVLPATRRPVERDPVVFLAGGPGGAATQLAAGIVSGYPALRLHRDVLLVDQRGTGASGRLACPPAPPTVTDAESLRAFIDSCQAALRANFAQYGTAAAVDDVDAVRAALGYRRVNLVGGSYGVTAALVYLNRHPSSVRSVVLESGTLLEVPIFERWSSNAQRALDQIAARCDRERTCSAAFRGWAAALPPLLARLEAEPAKTDVDGETLTLDGDDVAGTIQALSRTGEGAAAIPRAVTHAVRGDYVPIARALVSVRGGEDTFQLAMYHSIVCNEPWAVADPARVAADAAGSYLGHAYLEGVAREALVCSVFPKRAERASDWRNPRSSVPALVLVGGADPQDPIGNIAAIRQTMPRARILVAPGLGHGVSGAPCIRALTSQFVARGTASGLGAGCVGRIRPPVFSVG